MENHERQNKIPLNINDKKILSDLRKEFKKSLMIDVFICFAFSFVMPFIFRQTKIKAIDDISFVYLWLIGLLLCIITWSLRYGTVFNYLNKYYDFKGDKKVVIDTKIKSIVHFKSFINISVTDSNYKYSGFQVMNERCYTSPSIDDEVKLYFLPKTKIVLELQKK